MKKRLFCSFVCSIFFFLFLVVTIRMLCALYVNSTGKSNDLTTFILSGLSIESAATDMTWSIKYPYHNTWIDRFDESFSSTQDFITSFCTTSFPYTENIYKVVQTFKNKVLKNLLDQNPGEYGKIADEIALAPDYVAPLVQNVVSFKQYCDSQGIPFLFVNTPSRDIVRYYEGKPEEIEHQNILYRSLNFAEQLKETDVDALFLAEDTVPTHIYQFDKSNHWLSSDALYATGIIANRLEAYGFTFDKDLFFEDNYYDFFRSKKNEIEAATGNSVPDSPLFIPLQEGNYTLYYAEEKLAEGCFSQVFLNSVDAYKPDGVYYNMVKLSNSLIYTIENHNTLYNADKKILIIGDSFDWLLVPYLSQQVSEVTFIHNASFTGSLETYLEQHPMDAVLMIYNDAEYYEEYSEKAFYLK